MTVCGACARDMCLHFTIYFPPFLILPSTSLMSAFVFDAGLSSWAFRKNLRASAYVDSGGDPPKMALAQPRSTNDTPATFKHHWPRANATVASSGRSLYAASSASRLCTSSGSFPWSSGSRPQTRA